MNGDGFGVGKRHSVGLGVSKLTYLRLVRLEVRRGAGESTLHIYFRHTGMANGILLQHLRLTSWFVNRHGTM